MKNKLSKLLFFLFFFLESFLLSNLITFLFLIHLKWFRVPYEHHLKFYKSSLNFNNNRITYKCIFEVLGTGFRSSFNLGGAKVQGHFVNSLIGLCEVFSFWANFCTFSTWRIWFLHIQSILEKLAVTKFEK